MDAKITITTECGAKCRTCPVHTMPKEFMDFDYFTRMWDKLMHEDRYINRVLLNNTGDMYYHPDCDRMFDYIEEHHYRPVIMTTNASRMKRIPKIDEIVISFNGGTKEAYEYTTGLDFDAVVKNIKDAYEELEKVPTLQLHCLIWEGNKGTERDLAELWKDFPGSVRISYKYDNQMKEDYTLAQYKRYDREPCKYLGMLSIMPDGQIISCAHDFEQTRNFGNYVENDTFDIIMHPQRQEILAAHYEGKYPGICEKCNFNTPDRGKVFYVEV
jgi:radical SAM protein with 4Fe4S-binding SPASM domain